MKNPSIDSLGNTKYYDDEGLCHRDDGPAYLSTGYQSWHFHGIFHREDGPAREWYSGYKEWWYNGKIIFCKSQEEFERIVKLKAFW